MSETHMIGVVVVTHGQFATELVNAAEAIVGDLPRFAAVSIGWHDDVDIAREEIGRALARVQGPHGAVLLTDMFGGTPSNLAISVMTGAGVEVIAGVNLPMLIKLAGIRGDNDMEKALVDASEAGRKYINVASRVLSGK